MKKEQEKSEYLLFTRINRGDDLIHIGSFEAASDDLARVYAKYIYDEEDWVEMHVVPKSDLITVRLPDALFPEKAVI